MGTYTPLFSILISELERPEKTESFWDTVPLIEKKYRTSQIWGSRSRDSWHQVYVDSLTHSYGTTGLEYLQAEIVSLAGSVLRIRKENVTAQGNP